MHDTWICVHILIWQSTQSILVYHKGNLKFNFLDLLASAWKLNYQRKRGSFFKVVPSKYHQNICLHFRIRIYFLAVVILWVDQKQNKHSPSEELLCSVYCKLTGKLHAAFFPPDWKTNNLFDQECLLFHGQCGPKNPKVSDLADLPPIKLNSANYTISCWKVILIR